MLKLAYDEIRCITWLDKNIETMQLFLDPPGTALFA